MTIMMILMMVVMMIIIIIIIKMVIVIYGSLIFDPFLPSFLIYLIFVLVFFLLFFVFCLSFSFFLCNHIVLFFIYLFIYLFITHKHSFLLSLFSVNPALPAILRMSSCPNPRFPVYVSQWRRTSFGYCSYDWLCVANDWHSSNHCHTMTNGTKITAE